MRRSISKSPQQAPGQLGTGRRHLRLWVPMSPRRCWPIRGDRTGGGAGCPVIRRWACCAIRGSRAHVQSETRAALGFQTLAQAQGRQFVIAAVLRAEGDRIGLFDR